MYSFHWHALIPRVWFGSWATDLRNPGGIYETPFKRNALLPVHGKALKLYMRRAWFNNTVIRHCWHHYTVEVIPSCLHIRRVTQKHRTFTLFVHLPMFLSPSSALHAQMLPTHVVNPSPYKRLMSVSNYPNKTAIFTALDSAPACNHNERTDALTGPVLSSHLKAVGARVKNRGSQHVCFIIDVPFLSFNEKTFSCWTSYVMNFVLLRSTTQRNNA
jgi:hypothetical protein